MHKQLRAAVAGALLMAMLGGTTYAVADGEGRPLLGGARNPGNDQSQALTRETEIIANTSTYGTRQSNKSNNGGAAIYGCRSTAGNEACLRGSNLANGRAFEFNSNGGSEVGRIDGPRTSAPFTTSATGVATGLNADRVDSLSSEQIVALARAKENLDADTVDGVSASGLKTRWFLINAQGQIEAQSGGFTVTVAYPGATATPVGAAAGNVYVNAGEDLSDNGITATLALQNQTDQNGDSEARGIVDAADANPEFSGEISASKCNIPGVVACGPTGTNNNNHVVISPRLSDGRRTDPSNRKRFYVTITE